MKNKQKTFICALAICLCSMTCGTGAVADDPSRTGYTLNSSASDLMEAHSDRTLVVFGVEVRFKRYFLVGLLHQSMTVATDISNIRYHLRDTDNERTLIID